MKCREYRDLAELLRDGALAAAIAEEARVHAEGCDGCLAYEEECALLLAPLAGLPAEPFLPEPPPGLPPWATGSGGALLAVLAAAVLSGAAAIPLLLSARETPRESSDAGRAGRERIEVPAAGPAKEAKDRASLPEVPEGRGVLAGRIVGPDGAPIREARVSVPGGPSAATDAAGVFLLRGLAAGSSRLRLEAAGHAAEEFLGPCVDPGASVMLEEISVASPVPVELRVLTPDALPAAGARVRGCRTPFDVALDERTWFETGAACDAPPTSIEAVAGPDGIARFPALARGTWSFVAGKPPFADARTVVVRADGGRAAVLEPLLLEEAATLEGTVVDDETGEPVAGAEVLWVRILDTGRGEDPRFQVRAVAGPGGRFRFDAVPAIPLRVHASRPGADLLVAATTVDAGRLPRTEVRLPRVETLRGRCIDAATGEPAAGVDLRVDVHVGGFFRALASHEYFRSGPDGRFEVAGIPVGAAAQVRPVTGGAWTTAEARNLRDPGTARDVALRVRRTGAIRGTVRDAAGKPVAGIEVRAFARVLPGEIESKFPLTVAAARADADGAYFLENVPATTVLVVACRMPAVRRAGPVSAELMRLLSEPEAPPDRVGVAPGATVAHDLAPWGGVPESAPPAAAPSPGPLLRGRVVDGAGAPVKGARLYVDPGDMTAFFGGPVTAFLRMPSGTPIAVASDGTFSAELPVLPGGYPQRGRGSPVTIRAFAPDRPVACTLVQILPAGEPAEVRVVMDEGAVLEGTLLLEDGSPVAGAVIEAVAQKSVFTPKIDPLLPQAATGPDGAFRIAGLPREPHALLVLQDGLPPRLVRDLLPGEGPREIRLAPPFDLRGFVKDADGAPVAGAHVQWEPENKREGAMIVRTGADGSFALRGMPRVPYRIRVGAPSADQDAGEFVQAVTPLRDPAAGAPEIFLERALSLEGVVEDPTGAPSAGAVVQCNFERSGVRLTRFATSGPDGAFRLRGLPAGPHVLRVSARALAGEVEAEAGSAGIRVHLREATGSAGPDSFVVGKALDAAGKPLAMAAVRLLGPAGDVVGTTTSGDDGRFGFPANAGVRYTLTLANTGRATPWLDGVQGGTKDLVLRVGAEPGGSLRGRVVDAAGRPAPSVPVHAFRIPSDSKDRGTCRFESGWPAPEALARSTLTRADGAFDFGSPVGKWFVLAGSPGTSPGLGAPVAWNSAEPRILEAVVAESRTLRARVSVGDTPPALVEVRLESLLPAPAPVVAIRVRPGPDGTLEVPGLPAGPAVVVLFDTGGKELGRASVEPGEPGAPPVEIRVGR